MSRSLRLGLAAWIACSFFMGFSSALYSQTSSTPAEKKPWTFLIFLNANNNLVDHAYMDLREMEKVGSTSDFNIVVQFAAADLTQTHRIFVSKNESPYSSDPHTFHSKIVESSPRKDMGDPNELVHFVEWGMNQYPAQNYALILWNHGHGWQKEQHTKGISYDDLSGHHISTNALADALDEIVGTTKNRIGVLGFDACLMGMYEIGDAVSGMVDYLVGSEEDEPDDGYPYDQIFQRFSVEPSKTARALAIDIVQEFGKSYSGGTQGTQAITFSAVDLDQFEWVKKRFNHWLDVLKQEASLKREDLLAAIDDTINYNGEPDYRDLGDYVRKVLAHSNSTAAPKTLFNTGDPIQFQTNGDGAQDPDAAQGLVNSSLNLLRSINLMVIQNFVSEKYSRSTGLAIYLPYGAGGFSSWSSPFSADKRQTYLQLKWAKTTKWTDHLNTIFPPEDANSATPPPATPPPKSTGRSL